MMTALRALCLLLLAASLTACGNAPQQQGNDAQSYAARIGQATPTPVPQATPAPAAAPAGASTNAPVAFTRGTMSDPDSAICGAPLMAAFLGKLADQPTRVAIVQSLGRTDNLRFVTIGSDANTPPDPGSPRLTVMLDAQGIVREAHCG